MNYKNILTKKQIELLNFLNREDFITENFYLSGGTALAGFILFHRLSEDLDFFSEEEFDPQTIYIMFNENKDKLSIKKIDFQNSFNRNLFFLHTESEVIKTEFTFYPFPRIKQGQNFKNINIDSLEDITVNKLFTIYQNPRGRDFVDLYLCMEELNIELKYLILKAKQKFDFHIDTLQLGTQFEKSHNLIDIPKLLIDINLQDVSEFFRQLAISLKFTVLEN